MADTKVIVIPEGKICDYIDGKFRNDTPEEYVRQTVEKRLVNEHKYFPEQIRVEYTLQLGSRKPRADIVIFESKDTAQTQENIKIIIECKKETVDAMPIETVEQTEEPEDSNIAVSTSIPAIEQNLDASILVSNLKVDWEVPAGYASNTSAKRYLVKLGKIIQLNLKTELLLLSKPPITNKIAVEITYNRGSRKFEATGITISSGEKSCMTANKMVCF